MAAKKLKVNLCISELQALSQRIANYRDGLPNEMRTVMQRLADEVGIPVIDARYGAGAGDSSPEHSTAFTVSMAGNNVLGTLTLSGKDVAFIEFGAGIHYNGAVGTSPHPRGADLGFTIGSYGLGNGAQDSWIYYDESGLPRVSQGTEATMPLYSAEQEMKNQAIKIIKEVFALV